MKTEIFLPLENAQKALCGALCLQIMHVHFLCLAGFIAALKHSLTGGRL